MRTEATSAVSTNRLINEKLAPFVVAKESITLPLGKISLSWLNLCVLDVMRETLSSHL